MASLSYQLELADTSAREVFDWHVRPGALERLLPPWERVQLERHTGPLVEGDRQRTKVGIGPANFSWHSEIKEVVDGEFFRDVQLEGPFAHWEHEHRMTDQPGGCLLRDKLTYELPLAGIGSLVAGRSVRRRLDRMFAYRHRITAQDLLRHRRFAERQPLDILISGSTGLVGSALSAFLTTGGHRVRRLVRHESESPDEFRWNTESGEIDPAAVEGTDAVIHLAGENIAGGRWDIARKKRIVQSRVQGTRHVADAIRAATNKPQSFLCASAIGYYGHRDALLLNEESEQGSDFLSGLCASWEQEATGIEGVRSVCLRFGIILSAAGGALQKMLLPFQLGLGGQIGDGKHWMSWIALDDAIGALQHALMSDQCAGPINVVAPNPVTNQDFTRVFGRVISRPTVFPMPAPVVRGLFGEMGDALLLGSQRVEPQALQRAGFEFLYPDLEGALRHQLGH